MTFSWDLGIYANLSKMLENGGMLVPNGVIGIAFIFECARICQGNTTNLQWVWFFNELTFLCPVRLVPNEATRKCTNFQPIWYDMDQFVCVWLVSLIHDVLIDLGLRFHIRSDRKLGKKCHKFGGPTSTKSICRRLLAIIVDESVGWWVPFHIWSNSKRLWSM